MKRPLSFFAMLFILLFAVIGFIFVVFDLRGTAFAFELALLLAFMFFLAFGMFLAYSDKTSSWGVIAAVLALLLLNVTIIFFMTQNFGWDYIITSVFAVAGFAAALVNILMSPGKEPKSEIHYTKKQYYYPISEKAEATGEIKGGLKHDEKISATFTPGKYIASRKGGAFHMAKCAWASRISRQNQAWFSSKEEAMASGYSEHKCQM